MSIETMSAVWRHSQSTGRARLVLLAIADHQGEIGAWPSIATLAKMVNASERSVQRDIQELIALDELIVEWRQAPSRGIHKANLYWVNLPEVTKPAHEVTNEVDEVTDLTHEVTESLDEVTPVGVLNLTRTIKEPLLEYPQNKFEEFWNLYPRKVGKQEAAKAFAKAIKSVPFIQILVGVQRFAADPNKPEMTFLPYPATWLNRGGWSDEPYPERKKTAEELAEIAREKSQRQREVEMKYTAELLAESAKSRENASTEIPRCEHGNTIARCIRCLNKKS